MELADEESGRVWLGLICLPVKGGTWTHWTEREAPRPRARTMLCLDHNLHREYGHPSHILDTPSLLSWQAGPLRTSRTDRQTLAHFLIRGASYTLIPKPYLENARVILFWIMLARKTTRVFHLHARPTGKSEFLLHELCASTWRFLVRSQARITPHMLLVPTIPVV